jgi:hypothetical protein
VTGFQVVSVHSIELLLATVLSSRSGSDPSAPGKGRWPQTSPGIGAGSGGSRSSSWSTTGLRAPVGGGYVTQQVRLVVGKVVHMEPWQDSSVRRDSSRLVSPLRASPSAWLGFVPSADMTHSADSRRSGCSNVRPSTAGIRRGDLDGAVANAGLASPQESWF